MSAVAYDTTGGTISSGNAPRTVNTFYYSTTDNDIDADGAYQIVLTPSTSTNITPINRQYTFIVRGYRPTTDTSGRVLLQPTQSGVTIPTVTTLTNGATVSGTVDANVTQLAGSTSAANNLRDSALTMRAGTVQAGSTATAIITNLTETTTDLFKNQIIKFFSGGAWFATGDITGYNGSTKTLTVGNLPVTPSTNDTFVIL